MKKIIKTSSFPSKTVRDKVLTTNGKVLDNYCVKFKTTENLETGNYVADGTYLLEAQDYLQKEDILKVKLDYGYEIFRISKITIGTKYIDIVARQITISDTLTLYLDDVRPTNMNGQATLNHLSTNSTGINEITFISNIANVNTAYYQDMSLHEALNDSDNSFIKEWGGEIQRRSYTLTINATIGEDRGVTIREGKNLTGFTGTTNIDSLITRARGKGFNGIKGNWINSPLKDSYARVHTKIIPYDDVKVNSNSETEGYATNALAIAELDRRIALEYSKNNVDKMKAIYDINFVQLEKTEEYKNYIQAERIYLGDTIRVYVPKIKTDIDVRAIERVYNVLLQKVEDLKLSNVIISQSLSTSNIIADLKKQYAESNNNSISQYIDAIIKAGIQGSYVVLRDNELLIMDSKDISTAFNVVRLNKNGLAFSQNGYNGTFTKGFTIDGIINADVVRSGTLEAITIRSVDGSVNIDLNSGVFTIGSTDGTDTATHTNHNSIWKHLDGSYTEINASGLMRHNGTTQKEYHYLMFSSEVVISGSQYNTEVTVTLPEEFKGKDFKVLPAVQNTGNTSANGLANLWCQQQSINKANGTFNILAYARLANDVYCNIQFGYTVIA